MPTRPLPLVNANQLPGSQSLLVSASNYLQPSPETVVLVLAIAIGTGTGLMVVAFHYLIGLIHSLLLESLMGKLAPLGAWTLALVPSIGGLVVGLIRWRWQDFGASATALVDSVQNSNAVSPARGIVRAIAAAVSLGTGASLGPEGPSVEIGANIGIGLGQALQVSQERLRLLLAAGSAAGIAAGFNAPIAGVFFALEVALGTTFAASAVSLVLLAAVVAALVTQIFQGGQPAFTLPAYEVRSLLELPLYLGLGLLASVIAVAYTQAIQLSQRIFQGQISGFSWMSHIPVWLRPVIGGISVGIVALWFPQVLGVGYETVEAMLSDAHFPLLLLLELLGVKLLMTAISLGSGLVGGLFAPAMFLGASLGAAYGKLLPMVLSLPPESIAAPPAYAMVGMAAVLAASARAPLTAILLMFELTRDYRIILPLMAAVGLSVWLADWLRPVKLAVSSAPLAAQTAEPKQTEALPQLVVAQAMQRDFLTLSSSLSVVQAGLALTQQQQRSALVLDETEQLLGIVTLQDINRAIARWDHDSLLSGSANNSGHLPNQALGEICTRNLLYTYEDELISEAIARMAARDLHQLPVVERNSPYQILGILDQEHISLAYSLAKTQALLQPYVNLNQSPEPVCLPITSSSLSSI